MSIEVISNEPVSKAAIPQTGEPVKEHKKVGEQSASSESDESELHDENSETSDISERTDEDEADSTDSENDEGLKDETKGDKPKKESKLAKRLKKLSSERTQARLDADQARREAEFLRNELQKEKSAEKNDASKAQNQNPNPNNDEPNPEDFETNAAYIKAYTKWEIAKEKAVLAKESQESHLKNEYEKHLQTHNERVNQFKSKQPDYEQVFQDFIEDHGDIKFSPALHESVLSSEFGPAVIYELLKNPENFKRINSLGENQAAREFGKIEARLEKSSEPIKEIKTTKAPAPISPVGAKGISKKSIFDSDLSQADYENMRRQQMKAARGY